MNVLRSRLWLAACAAATATTLAVHAQTPARSELINALRLAIDRGELLFLYDRAAWLGTDDFRNHYAHLMSQAGGYVVSGDESRTDLAFYDKSQSKAVYRATFALGKLTNSGPPAADRVELTPLEKRLIHAKEKGLAAFREAKVGLCADANPNLAAIPSTAPDGSIIVYLMTPQTDLKSYPLGGHFSVEISQDGAVGKVRHFTKSCISMPLNQVPKGAEPRAFVITHLLDSTPTEIHVFTSLASKVPLVVVTSPDGRMWSVEGSRITRGESVLKK